MRSLRRTNANSTGNASNTSQRPSNIDQNNFSFLATSFHTGENSPKHISISYSSSDHDLFYETVVLLFSLSSFFLQLLHLYRTVWWLPQSYEVNAVVSSYLFIINIFFIDPQFIHLLFQKFYLVNPYLIGYVLTIVSPRWLWTCFFKTFILNLAPPSWQKAAERGCQIIALSFLAIIHFYCVSQLISSEEDDESSYLNVNKTFGICCLIYP